MRTTFSPSEFAATTSDGPRVLLTVEAAAERLSVGRTTMYALIKAGHVTTVRVGNLRRVPADALSEYVEQLKDQQAAA